MNPENRIRRYKDSLNELKKLYPKMPLEEIYMKSRQGFYKDFQKDFPALYKHVFGRKYILPNYRQPDYHRAEACDYLMVDSMFGYLQGHFPESDHVSGHCISNFIQSLWYDKPTFYLEKELGWPLLKTPIPADYETNEIRWRWPALRVYLPKGLLQMTKGVDGKPVTSHVMFLDIAYIEKDSTLHIPPDINNEITRNFGPPGMSGLHRIPLRKSSFEGFCVSCFFDFDAPESAIAYAASAPLEAGSIRQLMKSMEEGKDELPSPYKLDDVDREFNNRMLAFAVNILMFLSALPIEYEPDEKPLRQPKVEGRRLIPGLYPARFIGQSQIRPKAGEPHTVIHSGKTFDPQWRCGHWKRIWFGPGKKEWRRQWIGLYHTGDTEPEKKKS